jgi:hypothetical protein
MASITTLEMAPRATPPKPPGRQKHVFLDVADGVLKTIDSEGTVRPLGEEGDPEAYVVSLMGEPNGLATLNGNRKIPVAQLPDSSPTARGIIRVASEAEVLAGEDSEKAVTPATLASALKKFRDET